jgi:hypothetical protein
MTPPLCPTHGRPLVRVVREFCPQCQGAAGGAAGSKDAKRKAATARWAKAKAPQSAPRNPRGRPASG